jgi:hypothetical protein
MDEVKQYKKYICNNVIELSRINKIDIFSFLKNKINDKFIIQNSDGIRINLDNLDETTIFELHNLIKYKIEDDKKK